MLFSLVKMLLNHIEDGDFIVLHAVEEPVELLMPEAKKIGKKFEVLILRQDVVKTNQVINIMEKKNYYTYDDLIDCGNGKLFGEGNAKLPLPP